NLWQLRTTHVTLPEYQQHENDTELGNATVRALISMYPKTSAFHFFLFAATWKCVLSLNVWIPHSPRRKRTYFFDCAVFPLPLIYSYTTL
ncbi:mCG145057, partial [Mus musculus]